MTRTWTKRAVVMGGVVAVAAVAVACGGSNAGSGGEFAADAPALEPGGDGGTSGGTTGTTGGGTAAGGSADSGYSAVTNGAVTTTSSGQLVKTRGVSSGGPSDVSALTGRDLVQKAYVSLRVDDVAHAATRAHSVASRYGGFVADESVDTDPDNPENDSGSITIRVPESSYAQALAALGELGEQTSLQRTTKDVTSQTIDTASRARTQRASIQRIRALLANADELGQVIALESELTRRQADLESLEHQLHSLRSQVALATITTDLVSADTAGGTDEGETSGFVDGLKAGWDAFVNAATAVATAIGAALPFVALGALILGGLVWLRRRFYRRTAATTPPAELT